MNIKCDWFYPVHTLCSRLSIITNRHTHTHTPQQRFAFVIAIYKTRFFLLYSCKKKYKSIPLPSFKCLKTREKKKKKENKRSYKTLYTEKKATLSTPPSTNTLKYKTDTLSHGYHRYHCSPGYRKTRYNDLAVVIVVFAVVTATPLLCTQRS
ncbi:uncharacterized protein SPPG_09525 [Spizellomyces punctatus DAOM BR117]|uniref:Uncharacterized protein n=1 Tax=Spizellomyces punctatus (strain DAOM BR117) TaxID=645134 RepID=A0A0L0H5X9_SPIPD|nr:hypothetical protein, variant [Spizellomyces punctatus DAOM BR117]XP_016604367.1 uncharacterized protein SPPG_09525 [Spizellomyces punctatus DAOM BR117]KNC96326.1 hypothetical protein, variant [Spizellomyces punctatus DAOM BR117]KNC96327.1 hypothetical protein SPPG_09525 [Spizellomyces punctatus DAOM BR117]|eukprot:XP_016604366.1 hypothetical protein, variant [Spizellomyces punctatus DAOM BR117]